jgi:hypothetical protein
VIDIILRNFRQILSLICKFSGNIDLKNYTNIYMFIRTAASGDRHVSKFLNDLNTNTTL